MKCKRCNTENESNNRFCRNCGSPLVDNLSIPELFPEYNFMPTSVYKLPGERIWLLPCVLLSLSECFICMMGISCFIIRTFEENDLFWGITGLIIAIILSVFVIRMLKYSLRRFRKRNLHDIVDYVGRNPTFSGNYIVVKDSKFGLYNSKMMRLTIPCEYSYLSSKGNAVYMVEKEGTRYYVDMYDNKQM